MCQQTITHGTLLCVRDDTHTTGHVFHASECPDRHDQSEAMES